jgi:hypothetical protein
MPVLDSANDFTDSATDNGSTNVYIDVDAKRVKLIPGVGGLDARLGAIEKAVYSFLKEEWISDPNGKNLNGVDFPMSPITDEFYEFVDGWDWADATTRQTIRRGGWLVRNAAGGITEHWPALAILNAESDDQAYYDLGAGAVPFTFPGNTAEAVQVISDPNGDGNFTDGFDRSGNVTVYNREQGQKYSSASTVASGESSLLAPKLFSLGLPTSPDLEVTASDVTIAGSAPYTGMNITFYSSPQSRTIGASSYDFGIIVDGNGGDKFQIYEFVQWALRQATDQDSGPGSLTGNLMPELAKFVGPVLETQTATNYQGGGTGVYIDNFSLVDTNTLLFRDNTQTTRKFPFVAAGKLLFNPNLVNDPDAVYRVFFTDGVTGGLEFGTDTAIAVNDNDGNPIEGTVGGNAEIAFTFDYDGNNQGGRTPGTAANVTAIAIGKEGAQHVKTTATIGASSTNTISFVSATERNADYD